MLELTGNGVSNEYKVFHQLCSLQRTCQELDEREGIEDNPLLSSNSFSDDHSAHSEESLLARCQGRKPLDEGDKSQLSLEEAEGRVYELLLYLRNRHLYCFFCGSFYDSLEELARECPGLGEEDHD